jgi:alkyl hydroperoxide reductase subunit D
MEALYAQFPDYARDIKLNRQNVLKQEDLTPQQTWGTAVASAIAARSARLKAAAAVMGMNNIYYRRFRRACACR